MTKPTRRRAAPVNAAKVRAACRLLAKDSSIAGLAAMLRSWSRGRASVNKARENIEKAEHQHERWEYDEDDLWSQRMMEIKRKNIRADMARRQKEPT